MAESKRLQVSSRKVVNIPTFVSFLLLAKSSMSLASVPFPPLEDPYVVPSFSLLELKAGRRSDDLASVLSKTGMIAVTHVEDTDSMGTSFSTTRHEAFHGLCGCMQPSSSDILSVDNTDRTLLFDGITTRTSIATATMAATPLPLPVEQIERVCGSQTPQAMEALRDFVSFATDAFISSLDKLMRQSVQSSLDETKSPPASPLLRTKQGTEFNSVRSIVDASRNLEHFHVYSKTKLPQPSTNAFKDYIDTALHTHIDAGLFLSFVPAYSCYDVDKDDFSFYVSVDGKMKPAVYPQGSVIIMLGAGAEHWLRLPELLPLRATKHAVKMREGDSRAWYGMMHLVPENAVVQEYPEESTFADMRKFMFISAAARHYSNADLLVSVVDHVDIGCGSVSDKTKGEESASYKNTNDTSGRASRFQRRRLEMVPDASYCNNSTNFYCWMSCLDLPDYENAAKHIQNGESLYCLDTTALYKSGGNVSQAVAPCDDPETGAAGGSMNTDCIGGWQPTETGLPAQVVSFNATQQAQADTRPYCYGATSMFMEGFQWHGTACVVYLFPSWVISSAGKMTLACIGTVLFAMFLEGVIFLRRFLLSQFSKGPKKLFVSTIIYGVQLTLGYFIMLVVMTYSGPLFLSVVLGLMLGHFTFLCIGGKENSHVLASEGITPCCQNDVTPDSLVSGAKKTFYGSTTHSRTDQEELKLPLAGSPVVMEDRTAPPVVVSGGAGNTPPCCCSVDIENI